MDDDFDPPTEVKAATFGETRAEAEETVIDDEEDFEETNSVASNGNHVKARKLAGRHGEQSGCSDMTSECRMSGVTVGISFSQNTSGSIYVKDHFATCRALFTDSKEADLHIPFPRSDEASPRCPGVELVGFRRPYIMLCDRVPPTGHS